MRWIQALLAVQLSMVLTTALGGDLEQMSNTMSHSNGFCYSLIGKAHNGEYTTILLSEIVTTKSLEAWIDAGTLDPYLEKVRTKNQSLGCFLLFHARKLDMHCFFFFLLFPHQIPPHKSPIPSLLAFNASYVQIHTIPTLNVSSPAVSSTSSGMLEYDVTLVAFRSRWTIAQTDWSRTSYSADSSRGASIPCCRLGQQ